MASPRKISPQIIALSGLLSAVALVLLYLAGLIPSGWIGVTAVAGLAVAVAVSSAGLQCGFMTYIVSGLLAVLLIPAKQTALVYGAMFGLYPLLKLLIERVKNRVLEYLLKLVFFNVILFALYHIAYGLFFAGLSWNWKVPFPLVLAVGGSVIFMAYDFAFSKVMAMLQARLVPQIRRRFGGS